jgi:hypothetical protein
VQSVRGVVTAAASRRSKTEWWIDGAATLSRYQPASFAVRIQVRAIIVGGCVRRFRTVASDPCKQVVPPAGSARGLARAFAGHARRHGRPCGWRRGGVRCGGATACAGTVQRQWVSAFGKRI